MKKPEFIIQTVDKQITSSNAHEIKEQLDSDYSYLVGIAISDVFCSTKSVLETVKVKGIEILPEGFEAVHIITSKNVNPNNRFYTMFEPMQTRGDDITIRFSDPDYSEPYNLQVHLLLTNNTESIKRELFS